MDNSSDWVVVGRFGRPHGIKGLVTVLSFTEPRDNLLDYKHWHVGMNNQWQPLTLLETTVNNKFILAKVAGYPEREDVARLTNLDIAVNREQLQALAPGEFYWHELIGMHVVNKEGIALGDVTEVMATGSNDVLIVMGETRHLIPYLPGDVITEINVNQRRITVDWDSSF